LDGFAEGSPRQPVDAQDAVALLAGLGAHKIRRAIRLRSHNIGASDALCYNHGVVSRGRA
jgi:hypothetical protein